MGFADSLKKLAREVLAAGGQKSQTTSGSARKQAGQSTVTVSEGEKKLAATVAMSGARGVLTATATIEI